MNGMRYQPQGIARLDRGNPLSRGISDLWIASSAKTLAKNYPAQRSGSSASPESVIEGFGIAGKFMRGDGATQFAGVKISDSADSVLDAANTTWFILRRCRDTVVRNIYMHYGYDGGADSRCLIGAPEGSSLTWDFGNATAGSGRLQAPYTKDTNLETLVVVAGQVKGREIWRRGVKLAGDPSAKAVRRSDLRPFGIGRIDGNTAIDDVETYMFGVSNREWSDAEIVQWCRNPWQILDDALPDDFITEKAAGYLLRIEPTSISVGGGAVGMRASRRLSVAPAGIVIGLGAVAMRATRKLNISPAALAITSSSVSLRAARRLGVSPSAMAIAGGQVALRASRWLSVAPAAMVMAGGQISMLYAPEPQPGSYTLPVSAAAITVTGGNVGMRIARRLRITPASLALAAGAVRTLVGRRLMVSPAGLLLSGGSVTLRFSARGEPFDISKIHPSRLVIFEGSGSRITPFEGSGSRITPFEGSGSKITRFE